MLAVWRQQLGGSHGRRLHRVGQQLLQHVGLRLAEDVVDGRPQVGLAHLQRCQVLRRSLPCAQRLPRRQVTTYRLGLPDRRNC